MANIKSFPNNRDEYVGAEHAMRWLHGRTSGVFAANNNAAVAAVQNAMAVTVSDGVGWISNSEANGVVWWNDYEKTNGAKMQLTIDAADGALNRIDRVIVEWKTTDYADLPEIKILKGTPASTAAAPSLTNNTTQRQLSLAQILVAAGTTSITASMITDERLNPDVCGLVTDTLSIDTSVINAQFEELLDQLRTSIEQAAGSEIIDGSITTSKIAQEAVTTEKIAAGAVGTANLGDGVVTRAKLAQDAIGKKVDWSSNSSPIAAQYNNYFIYMRNTIAKSFTITAEDFAALPDGYTVTILALASSPVTISWASGIPVMDAVQRTNASSGGSITLGGNGDMVTIFKRPADGSSIAAGLILTGQLNPRTIWVGTAAPSGGSDGDVYIRYS